MPRVMRLFVQYFVGGGEEWCFFVDVVGNSAGVCIVYVMCSACRFGAYQTLALCVVVCAARITVRVRLDAFCTSVLRLHSF